MTDSSLYLAIVRPVGRIGPLYLLGLLRPRAFREHCRSNTSGTTVLHVRSGANEELSTGIADAATRARYARLAKPQLAHSDAINAENPTLAVTRDALPQLMSGQLRVRDLSSASEEVRTS